MNLFKNGLLVAAMASAPAFAIEGGYFGFGLGLSDVDFGKNPRSGALNLNGGFVLTPNWSLGVDISTWARKVDSVSLSVIPLSLVTTYNWAGSPISGFNSSFLVSAVSETLSIKTPVGTVAASETELGLGASVGYNFALGDSFGLGPKFTYVRVFGDPSKYNFWQATLNGTLFF